MPPFADVWMISLRSADVCFSARSWGLTPNTRTIPFEIALSAIVNGALITSNQCSGRARMRTTRSAFEIASILGTCSPIVMCSEVAIRNETANATTVAPVPSPSAGSISDAIAGSPRKPMPIEARVIPTWHAASDSSIVSICSRACSAPDSPSLASASILPLRVRTSANSAATNTPLRSTSRSSRTRKSAVTAQVADEYAAGYFAGGRPWRTRQR